MNGELPAPSLSTGQCATLACVLEAAAPKAGNVHPGADFESLKFTDLLVSAVGIGPLMERAAECGVGATVLAAARTTWSLVRTNTNLGTLLLLAPLAAVDPSRPLRHGIGDVLHRLRAEDALAIYEAIRLMQPGGLGQVARMDVAAAAPASILSAMNAAAKRDLVARQYVSGFEQVFDASAAWLLEGLRGGWSLKDSIVRTHLRLMANYPDSLIARKCGTPVAAESQQRAAAVLQAGDPGDRMYEQALRELDLWLRVEGNRRNPGTSADLIAAGLFVALREGMIRPPFAASPNNLAR